MLSLSQKSGLTLRGLDNSGVGIEQMKNQAQTEGVSVCGIVGDLYSFGQVGQFDYVLLDSILHFGKKELEKEAGLVKNICRDLSMGSLLVICIQKSGGKVALLEELLEREQGVELKHQESFTYTFEDPDFPRIKARPIIQ